MAREPVTESLQRDESTTNKSLLKRREYLRLSATASAVGSVSATALSGSAVAQRSDEDDFNQQLNAVDDLGMDPEGNAAIDTVLAEDVPDETRIEFPAGEYRITDGVAADTVKRFGIDANDSPSDVTFVFTTATQTPDTAAPTELTDEDVADVPLGDDAETASADGQATSTLLVYRANSFEMHEVEPTDVDAPERTKTLSIVGPSEDVANYRLTVSGSIDANDENGMQQTRSLPSSSVEDAIGDTAHHYEYTGEIVSFQLNGPATVSVDDEQVAPEEVVSNLSDGHLPGLLVFDARDSEQSSYELRFDN